MTRRLTKQERDAREGHFYDFDKCWWCLFFGIEQKSKTELHHIAGRGKNHECRENFAALSADIHRMIQSRKDAELICLVLKKKYDFEHYKPQKVCWLRGYAETWWTDTDVEHCRRVMEIMKEAETQGVLK